MKFLKSLVSHDKSFRNIAGWLSLQLVLTEAWIWTTFDPSNFLTTGTLSPEEKYRIRVFLSGIIAVLALVAFFFVFRYFRKKHENGNNKPNQMFATTEHEIKNTEQIPGKSDEKVTEIQVEILLRLSIGEFSVKHLAHFLKKPHTIIQFHLSELLDLQFVRHPAPYSASERWSISQEGTRYLLNKGLIK